MDEQVLVSFKGEGSGVDVLSWGQMTLWQAMDRLGTWLPIGGVQPLPPGTTVDQVADELRFCMSRYQTMRTRLRFEPDGPRQVVSAEGEIALSIRDAGDDDDPAAVAEQLAESYRERDYDYVHEWPVRMAVVRHRGVLTHKVLIICHLVTDAAGAQVMAAELAARDPITGEAATPAPPMQPLAQARWQRSPAGRRQSEAAIKYAETVARTMPPRRFGDSADPRQPRYWELLSTSPATHLALKTIVARTGAAPSVALLTVLMIALARVSGTNPAAAHVLVNNRFRPQLAPVVGPHSQATIFMVDVGDASFDEAVARTARRSMAAYKHSYYDQRRKGGLEGRVSKERGEPVEVGCFINDRRLRTLQARPDDGPAPTPEQIRAVLPATELRCVRQQDDAFEKLFLHINDVPDTIEITLQADTHHISPADIERLLREIEATAVAGAIDGATPTGVSGHTP